VSGFPVLFLPNEWRQGRGTSLQIRVARLIGEYYRIGLTSA